LFAITNKVTNGYQELFRRRLAPFHSKCNSQMVVIGNVTRIRFV